MYDGPAKGAEVAAWRQSLLGEVAHSYKLSYISSLLDLVKAFDSVSFECLACCAVKVGYNLYLLRLSIAAYLLARVLDIEGCCSDFIWAMRGITAGSVLATLELKVLLIQAGDLVVSSCLYTRLTLYVDDATLESVCTQRMAVQEHLKALDLFTSSLQSLDLAFSQTKNVVCASSNALAKEVVAAVTNIKIKCASRVASLGCGLGAGVRRNAKIMNKRLKSFVARRRRFRMLRKSRVNTARILRTGGNAAMVFGQGALGVSDSLLLQQRRASASSTAVSTCGANLDITLLLADDQSEGAADPAFSAHLGVIHKWALALWEGWAPTFMLSHVLASAQSRLAGAGGKWNLVFGPAAALVMTLKRLSWSIASAWCFTTDDGSTLDLRRMSPAFVASAVVASVSRWRWRRIEHKFPALDSQGMGLGAAWRPVISALRMRDSTEWGPQHKGALRSLLAGRQWPQQRLHSAMLVESSDCQLCMEHPSGPKVGTLLHRCFCPALNELREKCMPSWLKSYLSTHGASLSPQALLAVTRGLFPAPLLPKRDEDRFDTFHWDKQAYSIPSGCVVFTDGSRLDADLPREHQAFGWAFAVLDPDGSLVVSAFGTPPRWIDTIQGCELWAVHMALQHATFPERLFTDCDSVRQGVRKPATWANSAKRRFSRVWSAIELQLDGRAECVHWMPAHTSEDAFEQKCTSAGESVTEDMWLSNQLVDLMAKRGAQSMRHDLVDVRRFAKWEMQIKELVIFLGQLTALANEYPLPDGTTTRDSQARRTKRTTSKRVREAPIGGGDSGASSGRGGVSSARAARAGAGRRTHRVGSVAKPIAPAIVRATKKAKIARTMVAFQAGVEAAFVESWCEQRAASLKPSAGPSASERMNALKLRVLSRVAGSMGSQ